MLKKVLVAALALFMGVGVSFATDWEDLAYANINVNSLPVTRDGSISASDELMTWYGSSEFAVKGYTFNLRSRQALTLTLGMSQTAYFILLDADFEEVRQEQTLYGDGYDDDYNRHAKIEMLLEAGLYYLIVGDFNYEAADPTHPFTISIESAGETAALSSLPTTAIRASQIGDTLTDSITSAAKIVPELSDYYLEVAEHAYTVNVPARNLLAVQIVSETLEDDDWEPIYADFAIFDADGNQIINAWDGVLAQTAGTYKIVFYTGKNYDRGKFHFVLNLFEQKDYYIDYMDGNDRRTGLDAEHPLASLDTALVRSNYLGVFHIMSDFVMTDGVYLGHSTIVPHGRNINITVQDGDGEYLPSSITLFEGNNITIGDANSPYRFIIDRAGIDIDIVARSQGRLEMNNVTVTNSIMYRIAYSEGDFTVNNCRFLTDTADYAFDLEGYEHSCIIKNTTIRNCKFEYGVMEIYGDDVHLINDTIANNSSANSLMAIFEHSAASIEGGQMVDNYGAIPEELNITGLTSRNMGGIALVAGSVVSMDGGFTMSANNYIVLVDSNSYIKCGTSLTAEQVGTILPIDQFDEEGEEEMEEEQEEIEEAHETVDIDEPMPMDSENPTVVLGFREGRRVLDASTSNVNNNFRRFKLADLDNQAWYIIPNGTVSATNSSINAVNASVAINVYPNPATQSISIDCTELQGNVTVVLSDLNGRTLMTRTVNGVETLDISYLSAGIYMVQTISANGISACRIAKQ